MNKSTKQNWFLLGNFPLISAAEIAAVLKLAPDEFIFNPPWLITEISIGDPEELINRLGGTIKIAAFGGTAKNEDDLARMILEHLSVIPGKAIFGLSAYFGEKYTTVDWVEDLGKTIKKTLKEKGVSARYVFNREPTLSSVTVQKNNLIKKGFEFIITRDGEQYSYARTLAVQPFDDWGKRDFGRPERDDVSGMLPPKLARMMLNLSGAEPEDALLDPFCGSGTIISEALALNFKEIIGTDISEKAVEDTKKNIEWLKNKMPDAGAKIKIFVADAKNLSKILPAKSIDAIVSEPYLGRPLKGRETRSELIKQADELKALYVSALNEINKVLKKNGVLVFILPKFRFGNDWLPIDLSETAAKLGWRVEPLLKTENREYGSLLYARPNQRVGREIWRFRKN
jgi:tRNA G10  N-methylase Trm11